MKLDTKKFAMAAAGTMGIVYVACAAFVSVLPDFSLKLLGWLVHLVNVDKFAGDVHVTLGGFIIGLVQAVAYTYFFALVFGWLYNRSIKPMA